MDRYLIVRVRVHGDRYHGSGEWAPSPARVFQALVAAAARGSDLDPTARAALEWLEKLEPPVIALPVMRIGQPVSLFVPNNDLDALGGDLTRVAEIRVSKLVEPRLLDADAQFSYAWHVSDEDDPRHAESIRRLCGRLYQFGRGVDMAWARSEILEAGAFEAQLARHQGPVIRPAPAGSGRSLPCPQPGSLHSLEKRYSAWRTRLRPTSDGDRVLFRQPPKPRFAEIAYEGFVWCRVYDLRDGSRGVGFFALRASEATHLVTWIRDEAKRRLLRAFPERAAQMERVLVGRKPNGADGGPASERVRIVPIPSIGHEHADRMVRRVLIEVPAGGPLRAEDIDWAISGLEHPNAANEVLFSVVPGQDDRMLRNFTRTARVWRTVTPAALPESARRRRIDPARATEEAKAGQERSDEEARAAGAVVQALRHVDVRVRAESIRVQREPVERHGERAEAFAGGTRFPKERLWHVEIRFERRVGGPLVIGDGRFLGLGLMAPAQVPVDIHAFSIESGLDDRADPMDITRAMRRAVMARAQQVFGERTLPAFFSGHDPDGRPARSNESSHLAFAFDPLRSRLLVVAPSVLDRRSPTSEERRFLAALDESLEGFNELRAGAAGCLCLRMVRMDVDSDPLTAPSKSWVALTEYQVTRHTKRVGADHALSLDLRRECRRAGMPEPCDVEIVDARGVARVGLIGRARLRFEVAVAGPVMLGRSRYFGGGVFAGEGGAKRFVSRFYGGRGEQVGGEPAGGSAPHES